MFIGTENAPTLSGAEPYTSAPAELDRIFQAQQAAFLKSPYPGAGQRILHLKRLKASLLSYQDRIVRAVDEDSGNTIVYNPSSETSLSAMAFGSATIRQDFRKMLVI